MAQYKKAPDAKLRPEFYILVTDGVHRELIPLLDPLYLHTCRSMHVSQTQTHSTNKM